MLPRRRLAALVVPMLLLAGCGWTPLYADHEPSAGDQDLRAIRVSPIAERIGQKLAFGLRASLNPEGIPTPARYQLTTTVQSVLSSLGIQSQGLGTRGKLDMTATFTLTEISTGKVLLANSIHVADSFDILANQYATEVAGADANTRGVEELRREIVARLTLFMQRRRADGGTPRS